MGRQLMTCPYCAATNEPDADYCVDCQAPLSNFARRDHHMNYHPRNNLLLQVVNKPTPAVFNLAVLFLVLLPVVAVFTRFAIFTDITMDFVILFTVIVCVKIIRNYRRQREEGHENPEYRDE